jgi:hypothetical protein
MIFCKTTTTFSIFVVFLQHSITTQLEYRPNMKLICRSQINLYKFSSSQKHNIRFTKYRQGAQTSKVVIH